MFGDWVHGSASKTDLSFSSDIDESQDVVRSGERLGVPDGTLVRVEMVWILLVTESPCGCCDVQPLALQQLFDRASRFRVLGRVLALFPVPLNPTRSV